MSRPSALLDNCVILTPLSAFDGVRAQSTALFSELDWYQKPGDSVGAGVRDRSLGPGPVLRHSGTSEHTHGQVPQIPEKGRMWLCFTYQKVVEPALYSPGRAVKS